VTTTVSVTTVVSTIVSVSVSVTTTVSRGDSRNCVSVKNSVTVVGGRLRLTVLTTVSVLGRKVDAPDDGSPGPTKWAARTPRPPKARNSAKAARKPNQLKLSDVISCA
jgi:hypothetical protein